MRLLGQAAALGVILMAISALTRSDRGSTASSAGLNLGYQPDSTRALRTAFRALAEDGKRYPQARVFRVRWSSSDLVWLHIEDDYERYTIEYDRASRQLMYGSGGAGGGWDGVTDRVISKAADASDPLAALDRLGCQSWP